MRREREIAQRVDVILASSSALKSRWTDFHKDVRLVHNALDLSAIRSVGPASISSEKKVFGYVGTIASRSEERRVGKECVSTCRSRWSPYHSKNNNMTLDIVIASLRTEYKHL